MSSDTMKFLKLNAYQETAVYRIPYSLEVVESYPLPPPSTVNGLVHSLLEAKKLINGLSYSIQGFHEGIMKDYQWFKKLRKKAESYEMRPVVCNVMYGMNLTIHISSNDENLLKQIFRAIKSPLHYPFLGRAEDLVIFNEVKFVNLGDIEIDKEYGIPAYIPKKMAEVIGLQGTLYRLPIKYTHKKIKSTKKKLSGSIIREFEWSDFYYMERPYIEEVPLDDEGDPIWLIK